MTTAFDRSKFKGTKLNSLRQQTQEVAGIAKPMNYDKSYLDYLKVEEGTNEFRIMPPLNPEELSYYPKYTAWLEVEQPSRKEEGKTELVRKPVFIGTVHCEALKKVQKDPILLYIKKVQEIASGIDDKEDKKKYLDPVVGGWGSDYDGIMPTLVHACYAIKNGQLGNFDIEQRDKNEMDKIVAAMEEEQGELFEYDIFSNPDEGYPLLIIKNKNTDPKTKANRKWDRSVKAATLKRGENWEDFFKRTMVTDDQLKDLSKYQSLKERFSDSYTMKDFNLAVEGLKRFDEKFEYGIFEDKGFIEELKAIEKLVPAEKESKEDKELTDAFDKAKNSEFSKIKAKKLLRAYIEANYEDEQQEYNEAIEKLSNEELKKWYNLALKEDELPPLEGSKEAEESEDEDSGVTVPEEVEQVEDTELKSLRERRSRRS